MNRWLVRLALLAGTPLASIAGLVRLDLLAGMPLASIAGFFYCVEGARYLVLFFVWVVCLPTGLACLSNTMQRALAKEPSSGRVFRVAWYAVAWGCFVTMVSSGYVATAAAWGFHMVCTAFALEGVEKYRKIGKVAPTA
jgi:hypothetical protein